MKSEHNEFVDAALEDCGPIRPFEPAVSYNPDGDCIEFLIANAPYYAQRIDGWVTVYRREDTDEIIGGLIKGVLNHLVQTFPGIRIDIDLEGGDTKIAFLLRAPAYQVGDPVKQKVYKDLIEQVEAHNFTAQLQPA